MFHTRDFDFRYGEAMKYRMTIIALSLTLCVPLAAQSPVQLTAEEKALMEAAYMGKLDEVRRLVLDGTPVDVTDPEGRSPFMFAAFNGHSSVVEYLLDAGAEIDAKDSNGRTALMYASSGPFAETVGLLLKRGADVNVQGTLEGFTPLMTASAEGLVDVVRLLLAAGADRNLEDEDGDTALTFARQNGHAEVVALLENPPARE
jgi:ankyrin repeat protein